MCFSLFLHSTPKIQGPLIFLSSSDHDITRAQTVPQQFTAETLAIAVASATIGALILGFITGFFCGKKCNKDEDNQLYADTDYEYFDQRQNANRWVIPLIASCLLFFFFFKASLLFIWGFIAEGLQFC